MWILELSLVATGMILFCCAMFRMRRVYMLVNRFVENRWVRFCWWFLGAQVVFFLCGYAIFLYFLMRGRSAIFDFSLIVPVIFFWGSVYVLLSSWLFHSNLRQRDRMEKEVLQATGRQLRAGKEEALGRLAGGVAHDFNNVLTVILGYAQTSLRVASGNPDLVDSLGKVIEGAEQARGMTRQLLEFCRNQRVEYEPICLNEILKKSEGMLIDLLPADVSLRVDTQTDGLVSGAADQIELILMNLILNARDAMPHGGELTVRMYSEASDAGSDKIKSETGRKMVLEVEDTGEGMDVETCAKIFDPYFTTKGSGTGLGLPIVDAYVRQHGGQITVTSRISKGTKFRIVLPEIRPTKIYHEKIIADSSGSGRAGAGHKTILIVDDDQRICHLTSLILREVGFVVFEANSGRHALSQLKQMDGAIDLLLTDVDMPNMTGIELVEHVARDFTGIHIVIMSGYGQDAEELRQLLDEGCLFISKPFLPTELEDIVEKSLALQPYQS